MYTISKQQSILYPCTVPNYIHKNTTGSLSNPPESKQGSTIIANDPCTPGLLQKEPSNYLPAEVPELSAITQIYSFLKRNNPIDPSCQFTA